MHVIINGTYAYLLQVSIVTLNPSNVIFYVQEEQDTNWRRLLYWHSDSKVSNIL